MRGRLIDLAFGQNRKQRITIELDADFRPNYDKLHESDITVEIKKYRKHRSLDANAYFHVLVGKISDAMGLGFDETKRLLISDYGSLKIDDSGKIVGFKLPASVNVDEIYPYTQFIKDEEENGKWFKCYLVMERSHLLDSKQMAKLIDGAIKEAQELEIPTDTPEQIALYKSSWTGGLDYERSTIIPRQLSI